MAEVSLPALALRLAISMGIVVGLMLVAAKVLRRAQSWAAGSAATGRPARAPGRARRRGRVTTTPIAISTVAPLARGASVAVVRAAGRELVLGVTETSVTLLHSSPATDPATDLDAERPAGPDGLLDIDLDLLEGQTPPPRAARIAALGSDTPDRGAGMPAWTDALETLRAMTARRA
jgi:flagellar biogenesis protein FliO